MWNISYTRDYQGKFQAKRKLLQKSLFLFLLQKYGKIYRVI